MGLSWERDWRVEERKEREERDAKGEDITASIYRPEYGQGIADCLRAVYGEEYPVKTVYDPLALQKEFDLGNLYYAVAINEDGTVVGCEAMYRSSPPFPSIYEIGAGVVIPAYRGRGIQHILYDVLAEYLKIHTPLEEIFGEPVCNHVKMQKMMCEKGGIETALEVDLVPAETFLREGLGTGRVSTLLHFACVKDRPQEVFVPERYSEHFEMLYADPRRERKLSPGGFGLPSDVTTQGNVAIFRHAGVARLTLQALGNDLDRYMDHHDAAMKNQNLEVSQAFLPLDRPSVGEAVEILRSRGYFLGGILPRWFDCDGLLMQRVSQNPNWSGIRLYSSRAEKILEIVRMDWEEVRSAGCSR